MQFIGSHLVQLQEMFTQHLRHGYRHMGLAMKAFSGIHQHRVHTIQRGAGHHAYEQRAH